MWNLCVNTSPQLLSYEILKNISSFLTVFFSNYKTRLKYLTTVHTKWIHLESMIHYIPPELPMVAIAANCFALTFTSCLLRNSFLLQIVTVSISTPSTSWLLLPVTISSSIIIFKGKFHLKNIVIREWASTFWVKLRLPHTFHCF